MSEAGDIGSDRPISEATASTPIEVERETADCVRWFNDERLHSAIDYRPPGEYEEMYRSNQATEPQAA